MASRDVRADEVREGDYIWSTAEKRWTRVHSTRRSACGKYVILKTLAWETWKHPAEGVAVESSYTRGAGWRWEGPKGWTWSDYPRLRGL